MSHPVKELGMFFHLFKSLFFLLNVNKTFINVFQELINELQTNQRLFCAWKKEIFKLNFPINDYENILAVEFLAYLAMEYISSACDREAFLH